MTDTNNALPEGYKMTELGPLPEAWKVEILREVAEIVMGQSPPGSTYNTKGEGMPFLQGKAEFGEVYPRHIKFTTDPKKTASKSSVLMSVRAPVGDVNIAKINYCIGRGLASISLWEGDNRFLFNLLSFLKPIIEKEGTGSTFKAINKSKLREIIIPLPPLPEQKKIAAVLSTVQNAKEKTEVVIKATKELEKSLMKHLFTYGPVPVEEAENVLLKETEIGMVPEEWEIVRLKDVLEKTEQKDPRKKPDWEFKYIDVSSIDRETLKIIEHKFYRGKNAPSRAKKLVKNKDVIFATVRPTLRRLAIIDEKYDGEICSTAFCVLRAKDNILNPEYLFHAVSRDAFINELGKIQRGASYPAVTDSDVKNQYIPFPSLTIQRIIAENISSVGRKIEGEENKKKSLECLFKTLLHNLMTAKIRVNNLEVET